MNKQVPEPTLKDLLDMHMKQIMLTLNCHAIGRIESFSATDQTASVSISYIRTVNGQPVQYPVLVDCPVVVLKGGAAALTFPISQGDECLLLFSDRDIDNWFASGQVKQLATGRLHSISDAIALVGISSLAHSLQGYDTTRAVLKNSNAMVGVGPEKVKIANDLTTLNTLLQSLMSQIESINNALVTLTTAMSAATPATVPAAIAAPSATAATALTAISATLTTLGSQIGGLLE